MVTDVSFAARSERALAELVEVSLIDVDIRPSHSSVAVPRDQEEIRGVLSQYVNADAVARLQEYFFPTEEIHAAWNSVGEPSVNGEFCLSNIFLCLSGPRPVLSDEALSTADRDILASLRIIDQEPFAGSGRITGIRTVNRSEGLELWRYDMGRSRLSRLDLDYGAYMDTALKIKGAFGWQYLFADVDFKDADFEDDAKNLRDVLTWFPTIFPHHSYADLMQRLEARL